MTTTVTNAVETIELETISPSKAQHQSTHHTGTRDSQHPPSTRASLDRDGTSIAELPPRQPTAKSNLQTVFTIFMPSFVSFLASFSNGLITVGLPDIARSLSLERALYLWPSSVYGLTSGASLLIAGSIADIVGARPVELLGITLMGVFALSCGFANTGEQLVAFRALQGVALAMHLPSSVALISGAVPSGRARNFGFACLGFSQPLGFAVGLVVSGVLVEKAGWRSGFYLCGGATLAAAIAAIWTLPRFRAREPASAVALCEKVAQDIDWVGGVLSSGGLAMLAYVLAVLSADLTTIRSAATASLLALSIVLLAAFPVWIHYRERAGKTALVPNKLWKNGAFTSTCIMIGLSWGGVNSIELFSSLYFQEIQSASPLAASLYLLPNLITGVILSLLVGTFVHRIPALTLVATSALICALSPLCMALLNPSWNYFYLAFWAQIFAPFSADVLFTVGLIIVSDTFPEGTQALAGAVFNTVAQIGMSLGIGLCQVVALGVQGGGGGGGHVPGGEQGEVAELLRGYRASFWTMFGYMAVCVVVAVVGLRKTGRVGLKRE